MATKRGTSPSFREAEPSKNLSPAFGDQFVSFNGLRTLGTPTPDGSIQSYRTADLLPARSASSAPDPVHTAAFQEQAQQIQQLRATNAQLQEHRNTLACELNKALTDNRRSIQLSSAAPTKATLQSMLVEANRGATLVSEQRSIMALQMQTAEFRIAELESWLNLAQGQASHCANTTTNDKVLHDEAVTEVKRLERRVDELTRELAEITRRYAGKYTAEQVHEIRTTLNRDNDARDTAHKAESSTLKQKYEREIATMREQMKTLRHESTTQAIGIDASSQQANFIRSLRGQHDELDGERTRYQRMADIYLSQLRAADDKLQKSTAAHYQSQAEARHETDALRSNILAMTGTQEQLLNEREALVSKVTLLQVEASTASAGNEQMSLLNLQKQEENTQLSQQIREITHEANLRIGAMVERSVHEDALAAHNAEVATTKVTHDHHVAELAEEVGALRADCAQFSNDIGWYQIYYQDAEAERAPNEQAPDPDDQDQRPPTFVGVTDILPTFVGATEERPTFVGATEN